jgi:carbamoyl-phosphate synthase small subunit
MKLWWFCYAGVDLISEVSCDAPYEWLDKTGSGWEFNDKQSSETFHVSIT